MKKDYMTRLERWARWMLPRQEAEDVLADYRDIVADPELAQDLGKPRAVIWALADRKSYYTWLGVFAALARYGQLYTGEVEVRGAGFLVGVRVPCNKGYFGNQVPFDGLLAGV